MRFEKRGVFQHMIRAGKTDKSGNRLRREARCREKDERSVLRDRQDPIVEEDRKLYEAIRVGYEHYKAAFLKALSEQQPSEADGACS